MKILLDSCVWGGVKNSLDQRGFDVVAASEWHEDPGDREILHRAHEEERVLVTLDKDFGELAILGRASHSGIVRLVGIRAREQAAMCIAVMDRYGAELEKGAIVTVEQTRVRIRPAET